LDPTGEKGILVGYSEVSKAYRIFVPVHRRIVVSRDVQFEEGALRRSRDMPTQVEEQQGQDSGHKIEELQSTKSQVQGTGSGTSVERETSGQDSQETDEEDYQHEVVPQEIKPRPRPKWYRSIVSDSRQVAPPKRSFRQSKPSQRFGYMELVT
jgi:hypothetical protein